MNEHSAGNEPPTAGAPAETVPSPWSGVIASPLVGIAPWVVFSLVIGPGRFEPAVLLALALSVAAVVVTLFFGTALKLTELAGVLFFSVLAVVGISASSGTLRWLETWSGEFSNVVFAAIAVASVVLRMPFTAEYAREETPPETWNTPLFLHINNVITGVWAAAFLVAAVAAAIGDGVLHNGNELWTGWIIQIAAMILAIGFTYWYPGVAEAHALQQAGEPAPPAPALNALFLPLAVWVPVTGILVLAVSGPVWLGILLLVAGVLLVFSVLGGRRRLPPEWQKRLQVPPAWQERLRIPPAWQERLRLPAALHGHMHLPPALHGAARRMRGGPR